MANDDKEVRLKEIDSVRTTVSLIAPPQTREELMNKAKQQHLLAKKVEEYELILEAERVAAVVQKHEELHPPQTEDCPICLDPINIVDDQVQQFACCGGVMCKNCAKANYENGHFSNCPLCRGAPARTEDVQNKMVKKLAKKGRAWAQYNLGVLLVEGKRGFTFDFKEGMKWLELAAEQHFPDALYKLGEIHSTAYNCMTSQSDSKAFPYFKEAADLGCPISQSNVGNSYMLGKGVEKDEAKAAHYFTLAFSQNKCDLAAYHLGFFYCSSTGGLEMSHVRAKYYLEDAAKKGRGAAYHPLATTLLALSWEQYDQPNIPGYSCTPQVVYWTRKAAGEPDASAIIASQNLKEMERYETAQCSYCNKDARSHHPEKLKRCTRCMAEWYCGKDCQKQHWVDGHKSDCIKRNFLGGA